MPSARRKSISRRRDAARASRRLATFAQLMRRTRMTAARSSWSGWANRPRSLETPWPAGVSLKVDSLMSRRTSLDVLGPKMPSSTRRKVMVSLASACGTLTPGFSLPMMRSHDVPGLFSRSRPGTIDAHIVSGTHRSGDAPTSSPKNPAGATPTISMGTLLTRTTRPTTAGSRARRRCQYA